MHLLNCIAGGQERVCLLDDETMTSAKGVMRATGDWVMVQNSHIYYLGRKDCMVKRHGQMLHLDALQQVGLRLVSLCCESGLMILSTHQCILRIPVSLSNLLLVFCLVCSIRPCQAMESLPQVESGVVGLHKSSRLVAFVVPKIETRTSEHHGNQEQHVHGFTKDSEASRVSSRALEMEVIRGLAQLVPKHSIPDAVLLVPVLPLTNHGTVCLYPVCITNQLV